MKNEENKFLVRSLGIGNLHRHPKVAMLLGSIPPKLDRRHEKAWVLLTSPTCTQLIYSIQSPSRLTQLPVLPSTSLPATILSSPPPDDIHCQVCQNLFDTHKMLLCDIYRRMPYGLPPPTPYRHPTCNLVMSFMHPAPPLTPDSRTTPSPSSPYSRFRL